MIDAEAEGYFGRTVAEMKDVEHTGAADIGVDVEGGRAVDVADLRESKGPAAAGSVAVVGG